MISVSSVSRFGYLPPTLPTPSPMMNNSYIPVPTFVPGAIKPINAMPAVVATRGSTVENIYTARVAVVDASGRVLKRFQNSMNDEPVVLRSMAKPFQALPLLLRLKPNQLVDLGLDGIAVLCSSQTGTNTHLFLLNRVSKRLGVDESEINPGWQLPLDTNTAKLIEYGLLSKSTFDHQCSGNHLAMKAAAKRMGAPGDYRAPDHPVQKEVRELLARLTDNRVEDIGISGDGCGTTAFSMPLTSLAKLYARLASDPSLLLIRRAMTSYPDFVGGDKQIDSQLMKVTGGRLVAKTGSDGGIAIGNLQNGLGLALKIDSGGKDTPDGKNPPRDDLIVETLKSLGWLTPEEALRLDGVSSLVKNLHGDVVGRYMVSLPWENSQPTVQPPTAN